VEIIKGGRLIGRLIYHLYAPLVVLIFAHMVTHGDQSKTPTMNQFHDTLEIRAARQSEGIGWAVFRLFQHLAPNVGANDPEKITDW